MVKEVLVISGKGGTGKTSLVASFAALAKDPVMLIDCDVDAPDLHLILNPHVRRREGFSGGKRATIVAKECNGCGTCVDLCRFQAVLPGLNGGPPSVDRIACEGCGVCARFCTTGAVEITPSIDGEWYVSDTRLGPMIHACLGIAGENSGKLVSLLRREARKLADKEAYLLILSDGAPGIGCPVIASLAGVDLCLIVTEPEVTAEHDLERVADLASLFNIPAAVAVNKADVNEQIAGRVEDWVRRRGLGFAGRISFDPMFTEAQVGGQSVVEVGASNAILEIDSVWNRILKALNETSLQKK